jgi:NAD(P)H dehydrogenase (quinone)
MIVVTGATGQLGRLVIASLLTKVPASQIVAAVRNVKKAQDLAALGVQVRQADYNQPASWDAALQGADKVLLISSSEIGQRAKQHQAVIDAAKRAGVKLLAYTSLLHADTSVLGLAGEHKDTEAYIRASGVPFVLLRNGWYTENYAMGIPAALSLGAVYGCAGDGRISSAARADYAEAAAVVLTAANQAGKTYELAGVNLPEAEYKKALLGAGLPEFLAELLANSDTGVSKGALFDDGHQLSKLIGKPTTAMAAVVKATL